MGRGILVFIGQVENVPGLDKLGKIVVDFDGKKTIYSGKEQWIGVSQGYLFLPGDRLTDEFVRHIDMDGCFGENNVVSEKLFRGEFISEAFLVPKPVVDSFTGDIYA